MMVHSYCYFLYTKSVSKNKQKRRKEFKWEYISVDQYNKDNIKPWNNEKELKMRVNQNNMNSKFSGDC